MPKNILYIEHNIDGTIGGSYYCLYELARSLDRKKYSPIVIFYRENDMIKDFERQGIEVHVLTPPEPFKLGINRGNTNVLIKLISQPISIIQKFLNIFASFLLPAFRFSLYIKNNDIDLVHINNSITSNHDWMLACKLARVKCICHERGINNYFSKTTRLFTKRLDGVISISDAVTANFRKHGIDYDNIQTIHDGIDPDRLKVINSKETIRQRHGVPENHTLIGVVGNLKEWKGQETVIRATKLIKDKFNNITCLVVGDVSPDGIEYKEKLLHLTEELDLKDNVVFTGYQSEIPDYMDAMDIFIHSSILPEPFGIVNLEAMGLKTPVIATNFGAPPEILDHGKYGLLVEAGNPQELADAVLSLLENPERIAYFGEKGYERLHTKYTVSINSEKTERLYDKLLYNK